MKISVKVDYACRVLAEMARLHGSGEYTQIDPLAKAEAVPVNFLAQILCAVAAFLLLVLVMTNVVLCVAKQHAGRLENLEEPDDSKPTPNAGVIQSVVHNLSNHETWILVCFTNAARLWQ